MMQDTNSQWTRLEGEMDVTSNPHSSVQPSQTAAMPKPREKYKNKLFKFGVTEVVLGSLSSISCIVTLVLASLTKEWPYYEPYYDETFYHTVYYGLTNTAPGLWCGAVIIASGILGIKSKTIPTLCMYRANMTVSIIAANFMGILCVMSGYSAGDLYPLSHTYGALALHSLMAVIGFVGMIICIVHSSYCCAGVCCKKTHKGVVIYTASSVQYAPQQMVQLANGQYMMVPATAPQPMMSVSGATYQPASQVPPQAVLVDAPPHALAPQMTKQQEAQMDIDPPEYTAHASDYPT